MSNIPANRKVRLAAIARRKAHAEKYPNKKVVAAAARWAKGLERKAEKDAVKATEMAAKAAGKAVEAAKVSEVATEVADVEAKAAAAPGTVPKKTDFDAIDTNGDGVISRDEFTAAMGKEVPSGQPVALAQTPSSSLIPDMVLFSVSFLVGTGITLFLSVALHSLRRRSRPATGGERLLAA
jgi:hypothetical protein